MSYPVHYPPDMQRRPFSPLQSDFLRKQRARNIVFTRLQPGKTLQDVADKFKLSKATISKEIKYAEKEGLMKDAEDILKNNILPLAMEILERNLEITVENSKEKDAAPPDPKLALEVIKGLSLLNPKSSATVVVKEETYEGYLLKRGKEDESKSISDSRRLSLPEVQGDKESRDGEILCRDDDKRENIQGSGDVIEGECHNIPEATA